MDSRGKTSSPSSKEEKTSADIKKKSTLQSSKRSLSQASAEKSSPPPPEKSPPAPLGSGDRGRRGRPPLAASKEPKEGRRSLSEGQETGVVTTALVEAGGSRLVYLFNFTASFVTFSEYRCCGSGMFIPDPKNFSIPDQHQRI
jgi:hypothetical protein